MTSLVLAGGTVVRSLDPVVVEAVDLLVEDGRIAEPDASASERAGTRAGADRAGPDRDASPLETLDCSGCVLIPGNVCAHTHAYSALARGMPYELDPPETFVEVLRRIWWRLDRALDPASIRASGLVAAMEAVRAGTTTLVDHHASPAAVDGSLDILAEAFAAVGLRSILCYETSDRDGAAAAAAGIDENARFATRVAAGGLPLSRTMIGAHASFTLSDATLEACVDAASRAGLGIHVHVAEDAADERDSLDRCGVRVAERLARAGALDERSLLAHGVWLDDGEVDLVRSSGATVVHNARSNMNNRVGHAPLTRLGHHVALGTDGIGGDMFEESRAAQLWGRAAGGAEDPAWSLGRLAVGASFVGRAFGQPDLGRLVPGAPADLAVLDQPVPAPLTAASFPGHWTFGLSAAAVRDVVVSGRVVVRGRRPVLVDADAVAAEARVEAARLWERMSAIGEHPFAPGRVPIP